METNLGILWSASLKMFLSFFWLYCFPCKTVLFLLFELEPTYFSDLFTKKSSGGSDLHSPSSPGEYQCISVIHLPTAHTAGSGTISKGTAKTKPLIFIPECPFPHATLDFEFPHLPSQLSLFPPSHFHPLFKSLSPSQLVCCHYIPNWARILKNLFMQKHYHF